MKPARLAAVICLAFVFAQAGEKPAPAQTLKHRITGLFSTDREADLREAVKKLPGITLAGIDFANAEATFTYDPAQAFPGTQPDKIIERFDHMLREVSRSTFGVKPPLTIPREKLTLIEIPVYTLDCKACCWAVYGILTRIDGVEQATASFKEHRATALIDSAKTNREALVNALKERGVLLEPPK